MSKTVNAGLIFACIAIFAVGCDTSESVPTFEDANAANLEAELEVAELEFEFDWDSVPMPAIPGVAPSFAGPQAVPAWQQWQVETFYASSDTNFLSITQKVNGLFTPQPIGMQPLPPELEEGLMLGFTFHDLGGDIVGFGSQQEVLDFDEGTGKTTYALTIPGRGTLMLAQEEEFSYLLEEVADMIADQEYVRVFEPPLISVHTKLGSSRVVGGTGEFAHSKGICREIMVLNKLDLTTGIHDGVLILQVVHN